MKPQANVMSEHNAITVLDEIQNLMLNDLKRILNCVIQNSKKCHEEQSGCESCYYCQACDQVHTYIRYDHQTDTPIVEEHHLPDCPFNPANHKILTELNDQCEHIQELKDENTKFKRQLELASNYVWVHYYEIGDYYVCTFCGETAQYEHDLKHHTDCVIKS